MDKLKKIAEPLFPPVAAAVLIMVIFYTQDFYPFGDGTVTWCDMTQQTIPLLLDFKDILDGKSSLFFNINNAGRMNFYGVFFFYLSSPFSFLVKFVDKEYLVLFVNILVVLKLSVCALTAYIFFKFSNRELSFGICSLLSIAYALCGYGLLFYQNLMWLDVMYMFPIFMLALERLINKKGIILYIVSLSIIIYLNFYLTYMVAVFAILFAGAFILTDKNKESAREASTSLILGTIISLLLTAFVWLPSLFEYLSSGRSKSIIETLEASNTLSSYKTVLPLLFCSGLIFAIILVNGLSGRKRSPRLNRYMLLFFLTLVPFFVEPINEMWHTGNYMSFPARYGFITIFIGLICCADVFEEDIKLLNSKRAKYNIPFTALGAVLVIVYFSWLLKYIEQKGLELCTYTKSLWGDDTSFENLSIMFFVALACYAVLYLIYRYARINVSSFAFLMVAVLMVESSGNVRVYLTSAYSHNDTRTETFQDVVSMADKIDDDSFYRIITDSKITDYNTVGGLGYPSLGHYTSLTDNDYMTLQKKLGYTSVWMEVGTAGGTRFTNALYSAKYKLVKSNSSEDSIYSSNGYSIVEMPYSYGLGIITDSDLSDCEEIPDELTRAQIQQYIFSSLYNDKTLITEYDYNAETSSGISYNSNNGKYAISNGACIYYTIDVSDRQVLYADCFDDISNNLSEDYYDSLEVSVNGITISNSYPSSTKNCLLELGEFEDETVTVTIKCKSQIKCYSFGVFSLDSEVLEEAIEATDCANLTYDGSKLIGNTTVSGEKTCVLSVPYNDGFTVRVNGEKVEYSRVFSDFISFELDNGENEIEISFIPKGFVPGLVITIVGAAVFVLYILFKDRIEFKDIVGKISIIAVGAVVVIGFILVYVFPMVVKMFTAFKE